MTLTATVADAVAAKVTHQGSLWGTGEKDTRERGSGHRTDDVEVESEE